MISDELFSLIEKLHWPLSHVFWERGWGEGLNSYVRPLFRQELDCGNANLTPPTSKKKGTKKE